MRRGSWFGDAQLMPGERVIRTGAARIRINARPGWWEGRLVLTSDRLFFLPDAEHPNVGTVAVWISDVRHAAPLGKNRLLVSSADTDLLVELLGVPISPVGLMGRRGEMWTGAIEAARHAAPPAAAIERRRRAAG